MATREQNREAAARYAEMDNARNGTPIPSHLQGYVGGGSGGGTGSFGLPDPMSGRVTSIGGAGGGGIFGYSGLRDMFDGGGRQQSGDTFKGGGYSGLLNALGIRPMGFVDRQNTPTAAPAPSSGSYVPRMPMQPTAQHMQPPAYNPLGNPIQTQTLPPAGSMDTQQLIDYLRAAYSTPYGKIGPQ
jgi:hypothetical protein